MGYTGRQDKVWCGGLRRGGGRGRGREGMESGGWKGMGAVREGGGVEGGGRC